MNDDDPAHFTTKDVYRLIARHRKEINALMRGFERQAEARVSTRRRRRPRWDMEAACAYVLEILRLQYEETPWELQRKNRDIYRRYH